MRCYNNFEICEQSARLRYHINCFLFGPENSNLCSIYKWIPQAKPGWFPKDESLKGISSSVQHPVNYVVIILLRSTEAFTLCYWGPSYLLHPWKRRKLKNAKMGGKVTICGKSCTVCTMYRRKQLILIDCLNAFTAVYRWAKTSKRKLRD